MGRDKEPASAEKRKGEDGFFIGNMRETRVKGDTCEESREMGLVEKAVRGEIRGEMDVIGYHECSQWERRECPLFLRQNRGTWTQRLVTNATCCYHLT